jgi:hypothetical protein
MGSHAGAFEAAKHATNRIGVLEYMHTCAGRIRRFEGCPRMKHSVPTLECAAHQRWWC